MLLNFLSLGISIHGANKTKSDQSPALPLCLDFLSQASLRLGRDTLVSVSSCQINMILLEAEGKLKFAEKAKVARKPSHSKKPGKRSLEGPEKLPK